MIKSKEDVSNIIAQSQDGKRLKPENDDYSAFMLSKIDEHTNDSNETDTEAIISDFNYMINQLKAAVSALEA